MTEKELDICKESLRIAGHLSITYIMRRLACTQEKAQAISIQYHVVENLKNIINQAVKK